VIKNRVEILKYFNPDLELYGLFGGDMAGYGKALATLDGDLRHIYKLKNIDNEWAWLHGDLAVLEWYEACGKDIDFDRVYLVEWDALVLEPLSDAFNHIPEDAIGLTRLCYLDQIKDWWYWTKESPHKEEWQEFMKRVVEKYDYKGRQKVSIFPLPVFPKKFLEEYSQIDVETVQAGGGEKPLVHDEIRAPLYAELLGFEMKDTGFFPKTKNKEKKFFNADNFMVKKWRILKELSKKKGRRVFHPYRGILELDLIAKYMKH
jgi:hypothetical protein